MLCVPIYIALPSIRVQTRINDHDGVFEPFFRFPVFRIDQFIQHFHGNLRTDGFIAVHIITQPNHGNILLLFIPFYHLCCPKLILSDLLQSREILRRSNYGNLQWPFLVGTAIFYKFYIIIIIGNVLKIISYLMVH